MWRAVADEQLLDAFSREFAGKTPPVLLGLLTHLQRQDFASRLYAVTSLRHLRLTTATDYRHGEQHDAVHIEQRGSQCTVSYFEAGARRAVTGRTCSQAELVDVVEVYLLRLLRGG